MAQQIRDVMTKDVTTVPPDARLSDVARIMRDEDIGSVPVARAASCSAWSPTATS